MIVISEDLYNSRSRRVIVCPVTSNMDFWPTKLILPETMKTRGMVLTDQVRTIDQAERLLRMVEQVPPDFLILLRSYVGRLIGLEVPPGFA